MFCTIKAKTQKQTNELNLPPTRGAVCHVLIQHGLKSRRLQRAMPIRP